MLTSCAYYEVRGREQQRVSEVVKMHCELMMSSTTAPRCKKFDEVDATLDWKCALNAFKTLGWYFSQILPDPMSMVSGCRSRSHGGNGRLGSGGEPVGGRPWVLVRKGTVRY